MYYTSIEDLNLFYEVGDAPFGLYWDAEQRAVRGAVSGPGRTAVRRGRVSVYVPDAGRPCEQDSGLRRPADSVLARLRHPQPHALRGTLQFRFSGSCRIHGADAGVCGTQGHKLISQNDADPGNAALCMHLSAVGGIGPEYRSRGCGPYQENDIYQLPGGSKVYSTRNYLGDNYCPSSSTPNLFLPKNTFTRNSANSNYNSFQATRGAESRGCHLPAGVHILESHRRFFRIRRLHELLELSAESGVFRHST